MKSGQVFHRTDYVNGLGIMESATFVHIVII